MVDKNVIQINEKDACVNEGKCETPQDKAVVDAGYMAIKTMKTVEGQKVSAEIWNNDIMPAVRVAAEGLPEDASANEIARAAFPELFAKADKLKKEERAHAAQDKAWESAQKLKAMSKGAEPGAESGAESGRQLVQTAKGLWGTVSSMFDGKTPPPSKGRWGEVDKAGVGMPKFNRFEMNVDEMMDRIRVAEEEAARSVPRDSSAKGPLQSIDLTFDGKEYTFNAVKVIEPDQDYKRISKSDTESIYCVKGYNDKGDHVVAVFTKDGGSNSLGFHNLYPVPKKGNIELGGRDALAPMSGGRWTFSASGFKTLDSPEGQSFYGLMTGTYEEEPPQKRVISEF